MSDPLVADIEDLTCIECSCCRYRGSYIVLRTLVADIEDLTCIEYSCCSYRRSYMSAPLVADIENLT